MVKIQKWEYKIIIGSIDKRIDSMKNPKKTPEERLNALGKDGWEAYAVTSDPGGGSGEIHLKRPIL